MYYDNIRFVDNENLDDVDTSKNQAYAAAYNTRFLVEEANGAEASMSAKERALQAISNMTNEQWEMYQQIQNAITELTTLLDSYISDIAVPTNDMATNQINQIKSSVAMLDAVLANHLIQRSLPLTKMGLLLRLSQVLLRYQR